MNQLRHSDWREPEKSKIGVNKHSRNYLTAMMLPVNRKEMQQQKDANVSSTARRVKLGCCYSNITIRPKFCRHRQQQLDCKRNVLNCYS